MAELGLWLTSDRNNKIRGMYAPNGLQEFSVFDFITVVCVKNDKGAYARKWFGDNVSDEDSEFYDEFVNDIIMWKPHNLLIGLTTYYWKPHNLLIGLTTYDRKPHNL